MCNICNGIGWITQDLPITDPDFGRLHRCQCQNEKDTAKWKLESGLTKNQLLITSANLHRSGKDTEAMVSAVRSWLRHHTGILTMTGGNGTGKTTLAMAIVNAILNQHIQAIYTTGPLLLTYIRDGYDARFQSDSAMRRLEKMEAVPVLVLDELDKVKATDWVSEILSRFIDARYRRRDELGTVVIYNNADMLTPDVVSRLMEGTVILNNDPDYRKR